MFFKNLKSFLLIFFKFEFYKNLNQINENILDLIKFFSNARYGLVSGIPVLRNARERSDGRFPKKFLKFLNWLKTGHKKKLFMKKNPNTNWEKLPCSNQGYFWKLNKI